MFQLPIAAPAVSPTPPTENETDVVRVDTKLIQTGVSVFDKKGAFVNDLKQADFELRVNGKPVTVSFFEVLDGRIAPTETNIVPPEQTRAASPEVSGSETSVTRGRNIIFVIDDVHLSAETTVRAQRLILNFIAKEKQPDDTVAIISTSGKIGFLQQFTGDDLMLRRAAERVTYSRDYSAQDRSVPPMREYEAQMVSNYDPEVTNIFAQAILAESPGMQFETAQEIARQKARSVLLQAASVTRQTYDALEQTMRSASDLPGRKTVFLVSDGFLIDTQNSDSSYRMQRIVDVAARSNAVIYSLNAKGLDADLPEGLSASTPGTSYRAQAGERFERGDGMSKLADETGGKFIQNTNDLQTTVTKALEETSRYYLLAWEPESEDTATEKFRKIEIKVRNRPELKVLAQGGYLTQAAKKAAIDPPKKAENKNAAKKNPLPEPERKLNDALTALVPAHGLPTSLNVNYVDIPGEGATVTSTLKIDGSRIDFKVEGDKSTGSVDLAGAVYDSEGKRQDYFRKLITIDGSVSEKKEPINFYYSFQNRLKPGLYQIRIAARDTQGARVGSANQWIEIPDLTSHKLALSSLLIGERSGRTKQKDLLAESSKATEETSVNVDRFFSRASILRCIIFVYNARKQTNSDKPEVTIKTTILRDKIIVLTTPEVKVSTDSQDVERLFYGAEIPLQNLAPGKYRLSLTVYDHVAKANATRSVGFEIY